MKVMEYISGFGKVFLKILIRRIVSMIDFQLEDQTKYFGRNIWKEFLGM